MQALAARPPTAMSSPHQQQQCRRAHAATMGGCKPRPALLLLLRPSADRSARATVIAAAGYDALDLQQQQLRSFDRMQQAVRDFDRDMDSLFWGGPGRSPFAEAEREIEGALRRADEAAAAARAAATTTTTSDRGDGRVRVERSETRAPGTYRYYERIEITGGGWAVPPPAPALASPALAAPILPPLALLCALVAAGAYAALTAAFARNFGLTLYAARDKLRLALTWPVLLVTSPSFRAQFASAVVRGERVRVTPGVSVASAAVAAAAAGEDEGTKGRGGRGPVTDRRGGGGGQQQQQQQGT